MAIESGWRTLAKPAYGISENGEAGVLPAGTEVRAASIEDAIKSGPLGSAVVVADIPADEPSEPRAWYVTASALRFVEAE